MPSAIVCVLFIIFISLYFALFFFIIHFVAKRSPARGSIPQKTAATRKTQHWMHIVIRQQTFWPIVVRCAKAISFALTIRNWILTALWCASCANQKYVTVHSALYGSQRITIGNAPIAIISIRLCMCRPMIGFSNS